MATESPPAITSARKLYHEPQFHGQCGKLQGPVFSIQDLDKIAETLCEVAQENLQRTMWKNPFKSPMGYGYYDVNVLEAALNTQGCNLTWFDVRKDIGEELKKQDDTMVGMILHVPTSTRWVPFWKGQHWFGILRLPNGAFVDLDSRLSQPLPFEGFDETIKFLTDVVLKHGGRIFFVHRAPVESTLDNISTSSTSANAAAAATTTTTTGMEATSLSIVPDKEDVENRESDAAS
ncbi:Josephin-1 [Actinomortierella ambigua]|nr:Josephin-1 [Actinomortierella ambigua]